MSRRGVPKSDQPLRLWLCDTGCPYDVTSRSALPEDAVEDIQTATYSAEMETANGNINAEQTVPLQIQGLGEFVEHYLLENSPDVLSIGRRCELEGYAFYWEPYSQKPYFISREGARITLSSIGHVPYLANGFNVSDGVLQHV